jgi:putative hydroxymethylpyrimidine transport system substrate-binding protein
MRRVAAPLAAVLLWLALAGCGGGGAEPGAPEGATLVLDFQPNAVHSGIYAAEADGDFDDEGVDLTIREPSSTADSAKLLESGRADFAVMDISDFGIARQRGLDLVAIAAIVQRPLASVIARDPSRIRTPSDLAGRTVGVTGVPSDDAVLDSVLRSGGVDPSSVHRVTIGFNAVADLAAGKVEAATAFWNAEGVELRQQAIRTREFRVDEFGAPRYPELLVVTSRKDLGSGPACALTAGLQRGYEELGRDPEGGLDAMADEAPGLDASSQRAQLRALDDADAFAPNEGGQPTSRLSRSALSSWLRWAQGHGLVDPGSSAAGRIAAGFSAGLSDRCR